MKIKLKNIAKIIEADIDINGISVIAGNNNIGKSTILKSIYASVNTFRNSNKKILDEHKRSLYSIILHSDQYFNDEYGYLPHSLLIDFYELLSKHIVFLLENKNRYSLIKMYFHEALANYDVPVQDRNICSDEFLIPLYDKIEEIFKRPKEVMMKFIGDRYIMGTFNKQINFASGISSASIEIHSVNGDNIIEIKDHKIENLTFNSVNEPDAIYLPTFGILDIINRNYNYRGMSYCPEGDIFHYLRDTSNPDSTFEEYTEIESNIETVKEILEDVVNGNLRMSNNGSILYDDNDLNISVNLENVASGIKNFLLIKKLVENGFLKKNSILLIDEPETNLHPEWHLKFAEILVLMYKNMGVVSVVNSHSPYFIRALEVMMANYGIKDKANFYLMKEKTKNRYIAENVTNNTESIYETLYKPLENL